MLSGVLGRFSHDLAVDLGTSTTRVYAPNLGVRRVAPSIVAVRHGSDERRRVVAFGRSAASMEGRTPPALETVRPIRAGQIANYEVAEALLLQLIRKIPGRGIFTAPRLLVPIPHGASGAERLALRESCTAMGARAVRLVSRPLATALGAELPIDQPEGALLVDVGGGGTDVAVFARDRVCLHRRVAVGGEHFDEVLGEILAQQHQLAVGRAALEALKRQLPNTSTLMVAGRCLRRGAPRRQAVHADTLREALQGAIETLGQSIEEVLGELPLHDAQRVRRQGLVLTGGGSLLHDLDLSLRDRLGLPVVRLEHPELATLNGAARLLEDAEVRAAS